MTPRLRWIIIPALCVTSAAHAQQTQPSGRTPLPDASPSALTMEQAVSLARRNNPDYLATRNNSRAAAAELRSARGALLPQVNASLSGQYQQGGRQFVSGVSLGSNTDALQSAYNIGLTYRVNAASFITPRVQRANSAAVEADITGATENLSAVIRQNYLTALQSEAQVQLQDTLVANAQLQLELAKAKAQVGSGTLLDVQRAEVSLGQQQVARLQAQNQHNVDQLRLFQQMGVPEPANVQLVSTLQVGDSLPSLAQLLNLARAQNPGVVALRSREHVADLDVAREHAEYTPTLTLQTGVGGYTYQYRDPNFLINQAQGQVTAQAAACQQRNQLQQLYALNGMASVPVDCSGLTFTPAQAAQIRSSNSAFPFNFTSAPRSLSAIISLPLFDGFAREQRVQEAQVSREDARYNVRSRELALTADVTSAYLTLQTAQQTVALQQQNAAKARQELKFVQDQYAVGLATFVDLTTSRTAFAQAEADRINAVYNYHKALAALESAIGRP
ncbi:MAG: TolC family protein, partial [Gemmatimonadaceae bacterium]